MINFKTRKERMKDLQEQEPFYKIQAQLIAARKKAKLSQEDIAKKMQPPQSAVARFESSSKSCNFNTIVSYARAVGLKKLVIEL